MSLETALNRNGQIANLVVLVLSQALWVSSGSIVLSLSGIVGAELATAKFLSTLPFASMLVIGSIVSIPASLFMLRYGRRAGFRLGIFAGCLSGIIAAIGITYESFWVFCLGIAAWGVPAAFGQYYRYAASEVVGPELSGRAISSVLAGSILGVLAGPRIAIVAKDLAAPHEYAGSFVAISLQCVLAIVVIQLLRAPRPSQKGSLDREVSFALLTHPSVMAGLVNGAVGFSVMVFVMTAAPLAIVHSGHSTPHAVGAIQWHLLGMYAPSFVAGMLVDRYGAAPTSLAGLLLFAVSLFFAVSGITMRHFDVALVALGVGWNFLYVSSTVILARFGDAEARARIQAVSEFSINGLVALSAFLAGSVFVAAGWVALNFMAIPLLLVSLAVTVRFWRMGEKRATSVETPPGAPSVAPPESPRVADDD